MSHGLRPTKLHPLSNVKALAASHKSRRFAAESNLTSRISSDDMHIYFKTQRDLEEMIGGPAPAKRNIFGLADDMNQVVGEFTAMKVRHWTRRELWNRLRWLKGELTRLETGSDAYRMQKHPKERRNMTRPELIEKRRAQIVRYGMALEKYEPLHKAITSHKRNAKKKKDRAKQKVALRRREIQSALGWLPKPTTTQALETSKVILVPQSSQFPQVIR